MAERLTTAATAEAIGVPITTLKGWLSQVDVPTERDSAGRRRFSPEALEVLEVVKELRGSGRTFETIRRRVPSIVQPLDDGRETDQTDTGPTSDEPQADGQRLIDGRETDDRRMPDMHELAALVAASVVGAVKAENDLAEKYARAAHRIGELEATTRGLELDRDRLAGELAEAKAERDQARALLAAPAPARPWWKVWG